MLFGIFANVFFAVVTADPTRHRDGVNYLIGYQKVQLGGPTSAYPQVGDPPELFLQSLYYLVGPFNLISSVEDVIVFNVIVFNVLYAVGLVTLSRITLGAGEGAIRAASMIHVMTLPGLPMQLGRQAIYLGAAMLLIRFSYFVFRRRSFLRALFMSTLTPFFHLGSVFVPWVMTYFNLRVFWILFGLGMFILIFFTEVVGDRFKYLSPTLKIMKYPAPFSNISMTFWWLVAIFLSFRACLIRRDVPLAFLVAVTLYAYMPFFAVYRLLFGLSFVFIPLFIFFHFAKYAELKAFAFIVVPAVSVLKFFLVYRGVFS
jgi:hypothetical protein